MAPKSASIKKKKAYDRAIDSVGFKKLNRHMKFDEQHRIEDKKIRKEIYAHAPSVRAKIVRKRLKNMPLTRVSKES